MSFTEKLYRWITIKKLSAIMLLLVAIPVLVPLGLPQPVSPYTKDFVDFVEDLPDGSVVGYNFILTAGGYGTYWRAMLSINELFIQNKLKLIITTNLPECPILIEDMVEKADFAGKGYEYGVDYVIMPVVPGLEAAWAAIASDFQGVFSADYYGTPISQLELVKDLKSYDEGIDVVFFTSFSFDDPPIIVRQFAVPYGLPVIAFAEWGTCAPFYPEYIVGDISWGRGASELEYYAGLTPRSTALTDARNLVDYAWIGFMVLGNIIWILRERKELEVID